MGLFTNLTPESFAQAAEKSGVPAAALASGYTVFFIYSTLIGAFAIVLAFMVARKETGPSTDAILGAIEQPTVTSPQK
jgi:PAT family beta-lactamase induction signal transducer AmpG